MADILVRSRASMVYKVAKKLTRGFGSALILVTHHCWSCGGLSVSYVMTFLTARVSCKSDTCRTMWPNWMWGKVVDLDGHSPYHICRHHHQYMSSGKKRTRVAAAGYAMGVGLPLPAGNFAMVSTASGLYHG